MVEFAKLKSKSKFEGFDSNFFSVGPDKVDLLHKWTATFLLFS